MDDRADGFIPILHLQQPTRDLLRCSAPEIPLHTNASENDLRAWVIKRKISGGTMSADGRVHAHDLGLQRTPANSGFVLHLSLETGSAFSPISRNSAARDLIIQAACGPPPESSLPVKRISTSACHGDHQHEDRSNTRSAGLDLLGLVVSLAAMLFV